MQRWRPFCIGVESTAMTTVAQADLENARKQIIVRDETITALQARIVELETELKTLKAQRRDPHTVPVDGKAFPR